MSFAEWFSDIQGKCISQCVLDDLRDKLGNAPIIQGKRLFEEIRRVIRENGYTVDAKYVYENVLGFHIDVLDLDTECAVLSEYDAISTKLGLDALKRVPNMYLLQVIADKLRITVKKTVEFPMEKQKVFDNILGLEGV